jgi:hypothetical protein
LSGTMAAGTPPIKCKAFSQAEIKSSFLWVITASI